MSIPDDEMAHIGCLRAGATMHVPSVVRQCFKCGADVICAASLLDELREMGYTDDRIVCLCLFTCITVPAGDRAYITDKQREMFRESGMTDEEINEIHDLTDAIIPREES